MALTKVGIVYDAGSHEIRRIIVPEDDTQFRHHRAEIGEVLVHMPFTDFKIMNRSSLPRCADYIQAITGKRPPNVP